jgi:hypothetical protein
MGLDIGRLVVDHRLVVVGRQAMGLDIGRLVVDHGLVVVAGWTKRAIPISARSTFSTASSRATTRHFSPRDGTWAGWSGDVVRVKIEQFRAPRRL